MTGSTTADQRIALQRFGLGPKPGGPARIGTSARALLLAEIAAPAKVLITDPTLPTYKAACAAGEGTFDDADAIRQHELRVRFTRFTRPEIGFAERLVMFWSNHFSMSVNKTGSVRATYGQLEREVIRPHVFGKFADMLKGVLTHPAMISYLDNQDSVGPNTQMGKWGGGINENLAREILELHTVGVGGGYTEADVTRFARIITGWSYVRGWESDNRSNGGTPANRGQFIYRDDWHEPGVITLMGKRYPATGQAQGLAVLADLAVHPKTAEHIAFKLVRHFITDEPTAAQVAPLTKAYLDSGGDLAVVAKALLALPDAWTLPLTKLRTPYEMAIAQFRAFGTPPIRQADIWTFWAPFYAMNNMVWEHGPPDGWSDESATWLNPDAARIRLDTAQLYYDAFFQSFSGSVPALADQLFGGWLSASSRAAVAAGVGTRNQVGILLTLPELQRR